MKLTNFFLTFSLTMLLFLSCNNSKNDFVGVWKAVDGNMDYRDDIPPETAKNVMQEFLKAKCSSF